MGERAQTALALQASKQSLGNIAEILSVMWDTPVGVNYQKYGQLIREGGREWLAVPPLRGVVPVIERASTTDQDVYAFVVGSETNLTVWFVNELERKWVE